MPQAALTVVVPPGGFAGRDVCLFVSYSPKGKVKNHVRLHLDRLRAMGIAVFFIMVADRPTLLNLKQRVGPTVGLVVRENLGFDFGAWADVLRAFPALWEAATLLLINDSVFGPFGPYADVFRRVLASNAALVGMTESVDRGHHYQSYFLAFRGHPTIDARIRQYWDKVESLPTKQEVIDTYELNLLGDFVDTGLTTEAIFPAENSSVSRWTNPTHSGWQDLVKKGYPYLKVDLLKLNPRGVIFLRDWREVIADPEVVRVAEDYLEREK